MNGPPLHRRAGPGALRCALAALGLLAAARAQEWTEMPDLDETGVAVRVLPVVGTRVGGQGFLLVEAANRGSRTAQVTVGYESEPWSRGRAAARRSGVLAPMESGRFFLPAPTVPDGSVRLLADVGGVACSQRTALAAGEGFAVLLVTQRPETASRLQEPLAAASRGGVALRVLLPRDLPPDWSLLSTFDLVLVDPSAELGAEPQEVLRRAAAGGGRVAVGAPHRLRPGPLRALLDAADGPVELGFGRLLALPDFDDPDALREAAAVALAVPTAIAGPGTAFLHAEREIPGLGSVPVRAFLAVILLFGIAVGPVNLFVLRRRRRPTLALLTVPALGFGTTLLILGYGTFHDGFGIQGVQRSFSVLDQRRHEVAAVSARTLFAGLSPRRLELPAGTMVECLQAVVADYANAFPHRLAFEPGPGELEGGVLPSRTTTTLVASQQGPARSRLRLAARAGGGFDLLADGAFRVAPGGVFVLRDLAGDYHLLRGDRLEPCDERHADRALRELGRRATVGDREFPAQLPLARGRRQRLDAGQDAVAFLRRFLPEDGLPPGSYAGEFAAAPWLGDLGLEVALREDRHFVRGWLAAEDFVP